MPAPSTPSKVSAALLALVSCHGGASDDDPAPDPIACDVEAIATALAGDQATDCGVFPTDAAPDGCAADALSRAEPFWVVDYVAGKDSTLAEVWVSDGAQVWMLLYDDYAGDEATVDGRLCVGPRATDETAAGVGCDDFLPPGDHYLVCGRQCDGCSNHLPQPFEHDAVDCAVEADGSLACTVDVDG